MELELQEWLFLILGLVIVIVLVHGFWVQYFGSDRLPLKLDKGFVSTASESGDGKEQIDLKAELPNGGARVVKVGASQIPVSDPAQARVRQSVTKTPRAGSARTSKAAADGGVEDGAAQSQTIDALDAAQVSESMVDASMAAQDQSSSDSASDMSSRPGQQETLFLVLNVLGDLSGQALLESLMAQGFEYGEKSIFHRFDDEGYPKISLANAVEPGVFDIASMAALTTPGVTVFMCAHECEDAPAVFEELLLAAAHLAEDLGAQLCDDRRSAVTEQTVAHLRQTVQEFQFRRARIQ